MSVLLDRQAPQQVSFCLYYLLSLTSIAFKVVLPTFLFHLSLKKCKATRVRITSSLLARGMEVYLH